MMGAGTPCLSIAANGNAFPINQRPIVLDQAFERFPAQVEAIESGIAALEIRHDAQGLGVVIEPTELGEAFVKRAFAGMSERRVTKIVSERQRFGEILVEAECARERAGNLRNLESMREPRAIVIAFVINEHLRFVGQPPERSGVDDPVAVPTEGIAGRARRLSPAPAPALRRIGGVNSPLASCFDRHCPH